ncbi:MAG: FAD-dependent oxidoreductase [Gaiellales bacterium]
MDHRILIVGGGIAGVETALTMAIGMPDAQVTIASREPDFEIVPNLVFVPFGVQPDDVRISLNELERFGIQVIQCNVASIDMEARTAQLNDGRVLEADTIVVSVGTTAPRTDGHQLRTTEDALALRRRLSALEYTWIEGAIVVRVSEPRTWTPPAYEFALLLDSWLRSVAQRETIDVRVHTWEPRCCIPLHPDTGEFVMQQLRDRDIEVTFGVSPDDPGGDDVDVYVDYGGIRAIELPGLPPLQDDGFYDVDENGAITDGIYVVGDAARATLKAAFATSWQARRVLEHIGGDVSLIGAEVDGVPVDQFEYHMDLGFDTLVLRNRADHIPDGMGHNAFPEIKVMHDATDKLVGTLVRQHLLTQSSAHDSPARLLRRNRTLRAEAQIVETVSKRDATRSRPPWQR